MKSISVFCGSNSGTNPKFITVANELGKILADKNIRLVYGGAKIGIMGAVADSVLENGGEVLGVIPEKLKHKEVVHSNVTEMITTDTMAERKDILINEADAFIHLPGGIGTLDELSEVMSLAQLGFIHKPFGLINIDGYFNSLIDYFKSNVEHKLMPEKLMKMLLVDETANGILDKIKSFNIEKIEKWIDVEH